MKVFIFEDMDQVSYNYHSGGGLVVIAKDIEHVKELISADEDIEISESEWASVKYYDLASEDVEPKVIVFPDAGCC